MSEVIYEVRDRTAYITINRPEKRNALSQEATDGLIEAFGDVRSNPEVWVAILTGAGDVAFYAGADLVRMEQGARGQAPSGPRRIRRAADDLYQFIRHTYKPTIAAIKGTRSPGAPASRSRATSASCRTAPSWAGRTRCAASARSAGRCCSRTCSP